ncbi:MAG: prepilin-type N-terminal cleavage/methylation domain-containing protein [Acidaminobacter sp.]|uniref:competence type IV pilus major pilin ComGC n=1 Tax=Acidaminobacter sp. TaxID=1872102 RepID=UPI00137FDA68|nr:prepilin-type N-terminal cleavage/methylation domain-containing protein [Acidaminobacter sp.]MZQ97623.1 prepilin-type N-terminal cleavage/methylation domain-containing protein [Acidaminobacter sp.]
MLRFFNKRLHNRKGFTLIELIVVIAILGILMLIAVPRLLGVREGAEIRADKASARTIASAIAIYEADTGTAEPAIADLIPEYLDVAPTSAQDPAAVFTLAYDADGAITITLVGGTVTEDELYPE